MKSEDVDGDSNPKAHYGKVHDPRLSADEMDIRRKENIAYEYLCHLEEAKVWIEACINETLPGTTELEEGLRNGVFLAKLGHFMSPDVVPMKKIYDRDQTRYKASGLHFRHTDNINYWLKALADVGLPEIFYPETTDIYDRKNMPRTIYCIHALSLYLFKLGKAPQIQDLYGKIKFTDAEISAMRKELEKYGIQMPSFSKIGGILANEMPVDEAALHAAVIAINDALDKRVPSETLVALQNPAAHLNNIYPEIDVQYQEALYDAKETKSEIARNKSMDPDSSYIPDVYDELLTQAEIQGYINLVNAQHALGQVTEAAEKGNSVALVNALKSPLLSLRDINDQFGEYYLEMLSQIINNHRLNNNEDQRLSKEVVQMAIRAANIEGDAEHQRLLAVKAINEALEKGDDEETLKALQNPKAKLPGVKNFAGPLYREELQCMKREKQASLDYDELYTGVQVLSAIAEVNKAIDIKDPKVIISTLTDDDAHITNVEPDYAEKYLQALAATKENRKRHGSGLLTHYLIQHCVNQVNNQAIEENNQIQAISKINDLIEEADAMELLAALRQPSARLKNVDLKNGACYHSMLKQCKRQKAQELQDPTAALWYQDIQDTIDATNILVVDAFKLSMAVAAANAATDSGDENNLLNCLMDPNILLHSVTTQCASQYLNTLKQYKEEKAKTGDCGSGWMMNRARDGTKFYFNVISKEYTLERSDRIKKDHSLVTRDEIQGCVSEVTAAHDRQLLFKANEKFIILVQSRIRGYLARKRYNERLSFLYTRLPAIIKIQSWWRMIRERRKYLWRLTFLYSHCEAAIKIQAFVRMYLHRKKYLTRLNYFRQHEDAVIKIQAFMRSNWAKKDYKSLMHGNNPPVSVVRKFVHLLDIGDQDYAEEIEVEKLRQQVVTEIRTNQQLESDLNMMDIKIGLLVKNRITLQDVISQNKTLKKYRDSSSTLSVGGSSGLKALSKQSRERLEAYQHLFYLLQTNPTYLAKLIFEMPQSRTTKFMESVILTLYNYASNQREEYLLLKLFKTALEEEVRSKVQQMSDVVTGNPMVVKMIVSFNRNTRGQGTLRELLNPLVRAIIDDRNLVINTNPIEVYKQWVNQMETTSGRASGLPYEVTNEQALKHREVVAKINESLELLKQATEKVLSSILSSVHLIPYSMRYMAKVLKKSLHAKFPRAPEKDILKIVGNLIYYRYINSAIVAPDAFDIIDVGANKSLTNDQRRNLGSVAKILQFAASNKGFGGDSSHQAPLNSYIMDAHVRFKKYFLEICDVEEPEVYFNMDQYTDVTRITKPIIYISIAEIVDTHRLLLEHKDTIAPDPADPLHELLDDLGEVPDIESLIGDSNTDDGHHSKTNMGKTEISLALSNKFEVPEEDQSDMKSLFLRTKRMVVDVIRCQTRGDTLTEVLSITATQEEENDHALLICKRERIDKKATKKTSLVRQQSMAGEMRLPLEQMKQKIQALLQELEKQGVVSRKDNYQHVINSIVQDIRNQRLYRQHRKQEMIRIRNTLKSLENKRAFFEEQIDYYNQYVKTCLDNLSTKGKKAGRSTKKDSAHKVKGSVKYSAAKLHEKGVVLDIEELPANQFKNVLFEIHATENVGVFHVYAKFMGVNMEKVELVFQDLLQLQYEGVSVMKMYKAKINVNLLIFLLNKKFYGK